MVHAGCRSGGPGSYLSYPMSYDAPLCRRLALPPDSVSVPSWINKEAGACGRGLNPCLIPLACDDLCNSAKNRRHLSAVDAQASRHLFIRGICLQDQITAAPGTSSCTPQELCGKEWLRSEPGFDIASSVLTRWYSNTFTVVSIVTAVYLFLLLCRKFGISWKCICSRRRHNAPRWNKMILAPLISGAILLLLAIASLVLEGWNLTGLNREATIAYDIECSVVHVTLSPELNYLNIGSFGRALRIAKMWFGV